VGKVGGPWTLWPAASKREPPGTIPVMQGIQPQAKWKRCEWLRGKEKSTRVDLLWGHGAQTGKAWDWGGGQKRKGNSIFNQMLSLGQKLCALAPKTTWNGGAECRGQVFGIIHPQKMDALGKKERGRRPGSKYEGEEK